MSTLTPPPPAQFFVGVLAGESVPWDEIRQRLAAGLGPCRGDTGVLPPYGSTYYERELGPNLSERIAAFGPLRSPADLPDVKVAMTRIEKETATDDRRTVNLDPGYVSLDHVIVATGKPRAGRPYLAAGVYAYIALVFRNGEFVPLKRTYPSYRAPETIAFFHGIRNDLKSPGADSPGKENR